LKEQELRQLADTFDGMVDLYLEPSRPGVGEPSVRQLYFTGVQEIAGKRYLQFLHIVKEPERRKEHWLVDPTRVVAYRVYKD
jgi:hypothetical protein